MPKLKPLTAKEVIKALTKLGFEKVRQSGSHTIFRHPDWRWVTVPTHGGKDVAKGTLRNIIKDTGLTVDEFMKLT